MNEFMKKHVDAIIVLGGVVGSLMWMNSSIASLKKEMNERFSTVSERFSAIDLKFAVLESDIRNINTILICKDIIPKCVALDAKKDATSPGG